MYHPYPGLFRPKADTGKDTEFITYNLHRNLVYTIYALRYLIISIWRSGTRIVILG